MKQGRGSEATEAVFCLQAKKPLHTGVRTGCHYLINLSVCPLVCLCLTFVVFTDCESCTKPISTTSGSLDAGEYGLTRRTCFVPRPSRGGRGLRAAVDIVVCFGWGVFFCVIFLFDYFFVFERTRPAASMRPPCLIYLSYDLQQ